MPLNEKLEKYKMGQVTPTEGELKQEALENVEAGKLEKGKETQENRQKDERGGSIEMSEPKRDNVISLQERAKQATAKIIEEKKLEEQEAVERAREKVKAAYK